MPPKETQSEINGRKIAGLEAHMEHFAEDLKEIKEGVKSLVKHGEEIALIKQKQVEQDRAINDLDKEVGTLKCDVENVKTHTNRILWILGGIYSLVVFIVMLFAEELKSIIFHR